MACVDWGSPSGSRLRGRERKARGIARISSKMKVKMLSRNPDNYVRETKLDLQRGETS